MECVAMTRKYRTSLFSCVVFALVLAFPSWALAGHGRLRHHACNGDSEGCSRPACSTCGGGCANGQCTAPSRPALPPAAPAPVK